MDKLELKNLSIKKKNIDWIDLDEDLSENENPVEEKFNVIPSLNNLTVESK